MRSSSKTWWINPKCPEWPKITLSSRICPRCRRSRKTTKKRMPLNKIKIFQPYRPLMILYSTKINKTWWWTNLKKAPSTTTKIRRYKTFPDLTWATTSKWATITGFLRPNSLQIMLSAQFSRVLIIIIYKTRVSTSLRPPLGTMSVRNLISLHLPRVCSSRTEADLVYRALSIKRASNVSKTRR